jgi:hypothetical protein
VAHANREAAARAVTNYDLVRMTQAGLGDDVIVSTLRARGVRLDLSPEALIALKQSGVSDRVLIAAQDYMRGSVASVPPATTIVTQRRPATVIVTPPPVHWMYHHRPYYRPHYHHHRGAGFYYHQRF